MTADKNCIPKNTIIMKKYLHETSDSCILNIAVTLIAVKREVAAFVAGFPWSECQVRKLATSHCTNQKLITICPNGITRVGV